MLFNVHKTNSGAVKISCNTLLTALILMAYQYATCKDSVRKSVQRTANVEQTCTVFEQTEGTTFYTKPNSHIFLKKAPSESYGRASG